MSHFKFYLFIIDGEDKADYLFEVEALADEAVMICIVEYGKNLQLRFNDLGLGVDVCDCISLVESRVGVFEEGRECGKH